MTEHSKFSASAAHRWVRCPGSIVLEQGRPDTGGAAAAEGTMLHCALEWCSKTGNKPDAYQPKDETFLTTEQEQAVQFCLDYLAEVPGISLTEQKVDYSEVLRCKPKDGFGTLDAAKLDGVHLHVFDAKFGRGHVSPKENYQMLLYALGAVIGVEAIGIEVKTITLHIMQPRTSPENEPWEISRDELTEWAKKFLTAADNVRQAEKHKDMSTKWEDKFLYPTSEACKFCKAKAICPALKKQVVTEYEGGSADVDEFDDNRLKQALDMLPLMKQYIDAVEQEAMRKLTSGDKVPGYKLIQGRAGNRKWKDKDPTAFLEKLGIDPYEQKLLTPSKAETQLAKTFDLTAKKAKAKAADLLSEGVTRNAPKPSLVTEDTSGEPWSAGASLEEFE